MKMKRHPRKLEIALSTLGNVYDCIITGNYAYRGGAVSSLNKGAYLKCYRTQVYDNVADVKWRLP